MALIWKPKYWKPAVAVLHSSGYSNHTFSLLEIIERGILTPLGTKVESDKRDYFKKERGCHVAAYALLYTVYYLFYLNKGPKPRILELLSSISSLQEHPKTLYCIIFGKVPEQYSRHLLLCDPWVHHIKGIFQFVDSLHKLGGQWRIALYLNGPGMCTDILRLLL